MTSRRHRLITPPPFTAPALSPTLSSSPLPSGTLPSCPITSSPFTSSPEIPTAQSPDYFEFTYTPAMDVDFDRIEHEHSEPDEIIYDDAGVTVLAVPQVARVRERRYWVVFHGRIPGIHDTGLAAAMQTQGFSNPFQRVYPDFESAEDAWNDFTRAKIYPGYGKAPWVVYLGQTTGIFTNVSELEASVRGCDGAVYRSCSSVPEGKIKFELFTERVNQMFSVPDPFSGVEALMPQLAENVLEVTPAAQPIASVQVTPSRSSSPRPPQVAESSKAASKRKAVEPSPTLTPQRHEGHRPGDGWYVVHTGVLPGVYYGVKSLKSAKPKPGGFVCAVNKVDADLLFLELTINGELVFTKD